MRYEGPLPLTEFEILEQLSSDYLNPDYRFRVVLSALYNAKTHAFAGDVLLREFEIANYEEKYRLAVLFGSFYQMRRTRYKIDRSIFLLLKFKKQIDKIDIELNDDIQYLLGLRINNKSSSNERFW